MDLGGGKKPDLAGRTVAAELKYLREMEMCAVVIAVPEDYDSCYYDRILKLVDQETAKKEYYNRAKQLLLAFIAKYPKQRTCACHSMMENAIVTRFADVPDNVRRAEMLSHWKKKQRIVGKYVPRTTFEDDLELEVVKDQSDKKE
jgi:hypothetical protein